MFHPVGPHQPAVYWRRRLVLLAGLVLLILLLILTITAISGGGSAGEVQASGYSRSSSAEPTPQSSSTVSSAGGSSAAAAVPATTTGAASTTAAASGSASGTSTNGSTTSTMAPTSTAPAKSSSAPATCSPTQLALKAVVGKAKYTTAEQPTLILQITNTGSAPCVQDASDTKIELRVYNGASRVWGSHDCKVTPGSNVVTLAVGQPAGFSVTWTGLTSQPGCKGVRQHVGAGTYTLYASLSGKEAAAGKFSVA